MSEASYEEQVIWAPQRGPQEALVNCPITLIGYGGARGGGKTDGVLGKFAVCQEQFGQDFNAIFFRKELPQADDLIERAKQIYLPLRAHWQDQKKQFTFPLGGRLRFRPLANDTDAEKFQGQNLSHAAVEEAGNYAEPGPIFKLFGALRGRGGGQIILTFNPGGVGHHWLKEMFIKPAPKGMQILEKKLPNGSSFDYIYLPSRVHDNQILLAKDPGYIDRLHMVGSPELVRAWLEGDFEIHEGSYFPEFNSSHIIKPFNIPSHWPRYLGYDWGYRSPFAAVWGAVSSGKTDDGKEVPYPKGAIVIYREMWGKGIDNVEQANRIASASVGEKPIAVADPSIFSNEGGPSINDQFNTVFTRYNHPGFRRADNDRLSGWSQIRQRLVAKPPLLYIFATCPYLLETLPSMTIDKRKPEDLDTQGNDHACFIGSTQIVTSQGLKRIDDLCNVGTFQVLSHDGKFHSAIAGLTCYQTSVITLQFCDNSFVTCTPDHKFMLANGEWKKAGSLTSLDLIRCVTYEPNYHFRDDSRVQRRAVLPLWELFQSAKEWAKRIPKIASSCLGNCKWACAKRFSRSSHRRQHSQQLYREFNRAFLQRAFVGTYDAGTEEASVRAHDCQCNTESSRVASLGSRSGMAPTTCYQNGESHADDFASMHLLREDLRNQKAHGVEKQILSSELQDESPTKTVKSNTYSKTEKTVYCLNVPDTGTFVLENGCVVHNCDALRYLCKARLIDSEWEQPKEVYNKGRIKLQAYIENVRKAARRTRV